MRRVRITLFVALAILAAAVGAVLSQSPPTVLARNSAGEEVIGISATSDVAACQENERVPSGTRAIRLSLAAFTGPSVKVKVLSGANLLGAGERGSAWSGQDVTVPLKAVSRAISSATICFATTPLRDELIVSGSRTDRASAARTSRGRPLIGRVKIDYLGEGHSSWLARASAVARHLGLGRAWSGGWVAFVLAALMLAAAAVASWLVLRGSDE